MGGRPFAQIAGPRLTPTSLRLASLPLDSEFAARLERIHRPYVEALKKSKQAAARQALIKKHSAPVNIVGGYRFPDAPAVDLSPLPAPEWAVPSSWTPAVTLSTAIVADPPPADDGIPDLLRRKAAS